MDDLTINAFSITAMLACNVGELLLFHLNLGDVTDDHDKTLLYQFFYRLKFSAEIMMKMRTVDPVQDAIITENVLAIFGVFVPLITSGTIYFTGMEWLDSLGEVLNGLM